MKKFRMIIYCIVIFSILVYVSIKPIKRLITKDYLIYISKGAESQFRHFNFSEIIKEGYILLHYTSLGRFFFYHPEKKEFKNIAFIPIKRKYFTNRGTYSFYDCISDIHLYLDIDSIVISFTKDSMTTKNILKKISDKYGIDVNNYSVFWGDRRDTELYLIRNKDNKVIKKKSIQMISGTKFSGYIKYNNEYYAFALSPSQTINSTEYSLIKLTEKNELLELDSLIADTSSNSSEQKITTGQFYQYDENNIYLHTNKLYFVDLNKQEIIECSGKKIIYRNIELINNKEMKETIMYERDGNTVFEGPEIFDFDRRCWSDISVNRFPRFLGPWDAIVSYDKKYICIIKSMKEVKTTDMDTTSKGTMVKIEKYLYNITTKKCDIVSFITYTDKFLIDRLVGKANILTEDEYFRMEGFETIRGKVVNGKFVKIKRGKSK